MNRFEGFGSILVPAPMYEQAGDSMSLPCVGLALLWYYGSLDVVLRIGPLTVAHAGIVSGVCGFGVG